MTPATIYALAHDPQVPKFVFGTTEHEAWTRKYRDSVTCRARETSGYYVVRHPAAREDQPEHWVLSRWYWNHSMPLSWDVPKEKPQETPALL